MVSGIRPSHNKMNHFRVIIVGAGPAGIAAAARLLENNVKDITILEAENRIGGRVYTSEIGGNLIELGAEWIHGEKDNVVYELASEFNLANTNEYSESIFTDTNFYECGSKQINKDISTQLCQLYERIVYDEPSDAKSARGSLGDYFMKEYRKGINELRQELDINDELANKFADIFEKWENSIDASDSWFETSLQGHYEYWECEGNKLTIWKGNGYRTLFDLLEKNFPYGTKQSNVKQKIKLNKKVTKIIWNKKAVSEVPNVMVECQDGTNFTSDHVISTFSLGVLKEKAHDIFIPPLSERKLSSIEGLGFGTVDKIFLKFPYTWWTEDADGFAFLWSDEDRSSDETGWISHVIAFHPIHQESSVLRGWIVGEAARRMESLLDEEVLDGCMFLLKKFMGHKYNIPRAEVVLRSTWYTNPHFRGSYSCRLLESDRRDVWAADLAQPECNIKGKPLLLFAGEATHDHYFSTVHGAVESGRREADRLLKNVLSSGHLKDTYEVVIVGAGISGLAAAKTLHEEGITDVLIIEAQDTPGGRIKSVQIGTDWLELGAQWIHGDKSEMFDICEMNDLVTDKYSQEGQGIYYRENGTVIDEEIVAEVDDFIKTVLENCEEYVSFEDSGQIPSSVGEELLSKFHEYLDSSDDSDDVKDMKKDLFYWHVRFHLIDNSCDDLNNLSAKAWGLYRFCGGNDYVNFKNGYKSLVDVMIRDIPKCTFSYSTPVKLIQWTDHLNLVKSHMNGDINSPCCSSADNRNPSINSLCVKVICNNGVTFSTNYVIVTSSLGYLKSNHEKMFSPPLPAYLTKAINSLGYGVLGKIFLIYDKPWWDSNVKGFQLVWSWERITETDKPRWAVDVTGFDVIIEDSSILLGWVGGEGARMIESLPESQIALESTDILRQFTGNPDIPLPERVLKSNWFSNEFVQGGYSHITVDYDKNGIDGSNLSRPVYTTVTTKTGSFKKPTILLAGEAVHQTHFSTVHGAYESGVSQARVVVSDMASQCR